MDDFIGGNTMGRTSKSLKNIKFAILAQIITTLLTFVTRTVMTWQLGIEEISLNGLFTEVIAVLSLTELGVGSAIVYNLYKPLAEGDKEKVCQLMTLFKKVYRVIAAATFLIGTAICPFIQYIIKDINKPLWYIRVIYMLFVVQLSASYLFTYKVSLLNADQNQHIFSKVNAVVRIIGTVIMIAGLYVVKSFVVYMIINIITTLSVNVVTSYFVDKRYPYLHDAKLPKEESKQIFRNVKDIFIKQLSGKITNSTNNILISVLVNTIQVGYYSYYSMIISVFKQLVDQLEGGINASVGNLFASESEEKCKTVLNRLTWMYAMLGLFVSVCIYSCMESFITLWMGEDFLLGHTVLFVLCINLFMYIACKPIYTAMHMIGEFAIGRNISIAGSVLNLFVAIVLGNYFGIIGIFLGTSATYAIQIFLKAYYVYKLRFKESSVKYMLMWLKVLVILICSMLISGYICSYINISLIFIQFIVHGVIGAIISVISAVVIYNRTDEFKYCLNLAKSFLKKRNQI